MLWAVWCEDRDDAAEARAAHAKAHSSHLDAAAIRLVIAGPLVADDGVGRRGSLLVFEADSREEVEAQVYADPFHAGGVWKAVAISAFAMSRNQTAGAPR